LLLSLLTVAALGTAPTLFKVRLEDDAIAAATWTGFRRSIYRPAANMLALQGESAPFVPFAVYMCLTKMAIAIVPPQSLPNF